MNKEASMQNDRKKLVSICVPCFNEVDNVEPMAAAIKEQMDTLPQYDYEIIFIDNHSNDGTRDKISKVCSENEKIKAIFNIRNFGQFNSPYYALCQARGDCAISLSCDFQDPPYLIPKMLELWEAGYGVVCPVKTDSEESKVIYLLRSCYYKIIQRMSSVNQIEHFTGFGLYGRKLLDVMKALKDPTPFLRGVVAELGPADRAIVPYHQEKRRTGKTHNNFWSLYDAAMLSFTSYTKAPLRIATITGFVVGIVAIIIAIMYLILKLTNWSAWPIGSTPTLLAVLVLGSIQLMFIGLLGEYVLAINARTMQRPLVVEEKRLGNWE